VLKPSFAYDEAFERNFRREAHLAAKFRHPHIIAIHYVGKEDDIVFFSMDLLEHGVAHLVREGAPVRPDLIVKVGSEVASALAFAHQGGVVHRDLKPDNILFDRHGNSVVTDFGIADAITTYTEATGTTMYIGTPKYMSPEQARGQRVDHRSDIYSLGVTLYQMATGRPPFTGSDWFELGRKHIAEPPVPPRELNPELDRELERVILRCLEKEPERRYPSAEALRQDLLQAAAAPRTVVRAPAEPAAPVFRPRRARGLPVAPPRERRGRLRGLLVLALLAGGGLVADRNGWGVRDRAVHLWERWRPAPFTVSVWPRAPVEPTAAIAVRLTGPVDPATVTPANVRLVDLLGAPVPLLRLSLSADGRTLVVVPDTLAYGTRYNLVLEAALTDRSGRPVRPQGEPDRAGVVLPLETVPPPPDTEGPRVAALEPAEGSELVPGAAIRVTFDEPVRPASVDTSSVRLRDPAGRTVPVRILLDPADPRTLTVRPDRPAESPGAWTLELGAVADTLGNLAPGPRTFAYVVSGAPAPEEPNAWLRIETPIVDPAFSLEVHVDGRRAGEGPVARAAVTAGVHRIEIYGKVRESAHRLKVYENDHRVAARDTATVRAQVREFGALYVNTEPVGGRVLLGTTELGSTPLVAWPVPAGAYTLRIEPPAGLEDRYAPIVEEIVIEPFAKRNLKTLRFAPR
jgi:hypothetical protein